MELGSMDLTLTVTFVLVWSTLYFSLCQLWPRRSYEWHVRSVTVIHALVVTCLAAWCAFIQGPWPFTDAGGPNTPLQAATITICLSYFLFDLSWCVYFKTEGPTMLLHHTLSIVGLTWCLVSGKYGTEMVATIFGSEMSNPFLQLRWYLKETGNYETIYGEIVDLVFMMLFGLLRIGVGSYLLYTYFRQPTDIFGRLGGSCIYLISWAFWISIVKFAINKYSKKLIKRRQRLSQSTQRTLRNDTGQDGSVSASDFKQNAAATEETDRNSLADEEPKKDAHFLGMVRGNTDLPSQSELKSPYKDLSSRNGHCGGSCGNGSVAMKKNL